MLPQRRRTTVDYNPTSPVGQDGDTADATDNLEDFGSELAKDARIWKIYVDETDRSDKEMVEGWNGSLDVLLIFAALFSAITTTMVVESSQQLQPDPAQVSAQTLLVISQNLIALSNNKAVPFPEQANVETNFSPSRSSILVNALWFSSLSLSVGVSLIAMLSKSWCYSFMSGRSGPKHQQAHRRQQRWDGMHTWKMKDILIYLPILMHFALLFFAIGLCIYLWDINFQVAIPVLVIVFSFCVFYIAVSILPLVLKSCPYSTPLSSFYLRIVIPINRLLLLVSNFIVRFIISWLPRIPSSKNMPAKINSAIEELKDVDQRLANRTNRGGMVPDWIDYAAFGELVQEQHGPYPPWRDNTLSLSETPADEVTCRMLKWLITYSENHVYVNVALQSIPSVPRHFLDKYMFRGPSVDLISQRLNECFWINSKDGSLHLKSASSIDLMLRYCRALSALATSHPEGLSHKRFQNHSIVEDVGMILQFCDGLFLDPTTPVNDTVASPTRAAIAASAFIPLSHWGQHFNHIDQRRLRNAQRQFPYLLELHLTGEAKLNSGALMALIEASPHWVVACLPELPDEHKINSIMLLLKLLRSPDCTTLRSQYFLSLALALAAMVNNTYLGWEQPSDGPSKDRALQVYFHHCSQDIDTTATLTLFGLLGLLDWSNKLPFNDIDRTFIIQGFEQVKTPRTGFKPIHTLPPKLSVGQYMVEVAAQHLELEGAQSTQSAHNEAVTTWCIERLLVGQRVRSNSHRLYALAVKVFCRAQSHELRTACSNLLNTRLDIPDANTLVEAFHDSEIFNELFQMSLARHTPNALVPTAMRHLWSITNRVFEARGPEPLSPLAQMLGEAFVLQQTSPVGGSTSPQNMNEIDFASKWWPWLQEMRNNPLVAPSVIESGILPTMIQFYEPFSDTQNQGVGLRERLSWWKKLTDIERQYKSTLKRQGIPRPTR